MEDKIFCEIMLKKCLTYVLSQAHLMLWRSW